jgi:uncharacterized membrane protein YoaK (UPF0700 family)
MGNEEGHRRKSVVEYLKIGLLTQHPLKLQSRTMQTVSQDSNTEEILTGYLKNTGQDLHEYINLQGADKLCQSLDYLTMLFQLQHIFKREDE